MRRLVILRENIGIMSICEDTIGFKLPNVIEEPLVSIITPSVIKCIIVLTADIVKIEI